LKQFHNPRHEQLAEKALNGQRLMDGENPDSTEIEDAIHWSNVYGELITFKERLLAQMRSGLPSLPGEAAAEVRGVDMAITRQQMERYKSRRAFWEQRTKDLAGKRPEAAR
jgi:hypothetical protein